MVRIGFIGLGVMGEPMCRNLARKSGGVVTAYDRAEAPLARLAADGVKAAGSVAALAAASDVIFLCLPSGKHVEAVCRGEGGLLSVARPRQVIADCGTSPVALARALHEEFAAKGAMFADAPIARTRQAAEDGTLSIMVGADDATFATLRPLLSCCASEVTQCGPVGTGQIAKIMNNMVLVQTVLALSEAIAIARKSGMDGKVLFETLSKGSADSFALRNHGMKAVLPGVYPERAFSTEYALKDIGYALELAAEAGVAAPGAELAAATLKRAIEAGDGALYWPVIARVIEGAR